MNKKLISFSIFAVVLICPLLSLASVLAPPPADNGITNIQVTIGRILDPIWYIFVGISILMFIVAGFEFLTAQGNPEKVRIARQAVIWGIFGILIAILGYSAIAIVSSFLIPAAPPTNP